jgi:hypothetical protein
MSEAGPSMPRTLRIAAVVLLVQGAGVVVAGLVELISALAGHPHDRSTATFLGALTIAYGAIVVLVGRGLARGRTWAGTPAFMVEFFAIVIGIGQLHTLPALSVALLFSAAVAFATLGHRDSREVLIRHR